MGGEDFEGHDIEGQDINREMTSVEVRLRHVCIDWRRGGRPGGGCTHSRVTFHLGNVVTLTTAMASLSCGEKLRTAQYLT